MKRSVWIAADLVKDGLASGAYIGLSVFLGLWLPLQAGLIDGLNSRAGQLPAMRHSLVMNASWPALTVLGLHAQVFFPRRLRRELEPLLAAPVADLEIVLGLSLPVLLVMAASPPLTFGLNMLGFWLAAGHLPDAMGLELGGLWLATLVACVWLTAFSVDALFRATTQGTYVLRFVLGYIVLSGLDALSLVLRFVGLPRLVSVVMILSLAAGAAALLAVSRRIDREDLIQRI